jgi:sugar/nucleoside kinase (ribokinase family)
MISANIFALSGRPSIVGTGLVAMDVLIKHHQNSSETSSRYAGGTCGNVLAILAWLGWRAVPIARLNSDDAGRAISSDLSRFGVTMKFAQLKPRSATPVIIERLRISSEGIPNHHFSLNCPTCGSWLPRYRPVTVHAAKNVITKEKPPSVFFFDRASPGAIFLAQTYSDAGSLIIFEPSGQADKKLQKKALKLAHICKYSREQFKGLYSGTGIRPLLEIQTMGGDGLRYRTNLAGYNSEWQNAAALAVDKMKDSAGAGDWLTAGLIFQLAQRGLADFRAISRDALTRALNFGQALAAWNCQFEGARGGMYSLSNTQFRQEIRRLMAGKNVSKQTSVELLSPRIKNFRCSRTLCHVRPRTGRC